MNNSPKHKEKVVQLIKNNLSRKKLITMIINGVENSRIHTIFFVRFISRDEKDGSQQHSKKK